MTAEESEQPGVLGNLPRSRPGQRSEKRAGARAAAAGAAKPSPAAKRAATTARKRTATRKPPAASTERRERPAPEPQPAATESSPDLITIPFRVAGKVAEVGLKTAGGILRRLPGR